MSLLDGKVILVTGAGRGLGQAHALALASHGASVVVNDLGTDVIGDGGSSEPASMTVNDIVSRGGTAIANFDDISTWDGAARAVQTAIDVYGRLDGLVNNAGNLRRQSICDISEEDIDSILRVHLKGSLACTVHACRYWKNIFESGAKKKASIVNTISDAMIVALPNSAVYSAAKAGIAQLTLNGSREAASFGVRMNAYSPRATTRMAGAAAVWESPPADQIAGMKDPGNASSLVAWLLSDESDHVSGQIFQTFGGGIARCEPLGVGEMYWPPDNAVKFEIDEISNLMAEKIYRTKFPHISLREGPKNFI